MSVQITEYTNITAHGIYTTGKAADGTTYYMTRSIKPTGIDLSKVGSMKEVDGMLFGWYSKGLFRIHNQTIKTVHIKDFRHRQSEVIRVLSQNGVNYVGGIQLWLDKPGEWFRAADLMPARAFSNTMVKSKYLISWDERATDRYHIRYDYCVHGNNLGILLQSTCNRVAGKPFDTFVEFDYGFIIDDKMVVVSDDMTPDDYKSSNDAVNTTPGE